ncbi:MAG: hypothetical protein DWH70_03270 [Planctomycetota bacterium]|nr:MAG: hypothetical protein DWH70_03270 [Planctomycetota bacterium]
MLVDSLKGFPFVGRILLFSILVLFSSSIYAQGPTASSPLPGEPGDKVYTRNLFSGVFAFISTVGVLVVICMPSRKSS